MKKRNYDNTAYEDTPTQVKHREERNLARRHAVKRLGKAAVEGKDVGHKTALANNGSNRDANTELQTEKANRGWRRGRHGYSVPNI